MIFVCENNHYAELSPVADMVAIDRIADIASPFGIAGELVDGNDVEAVDGAMGVAVARARGGGGPSFLELDTYRQAGHFEGDQMRYRSKDEAAEWALRDPLRLAAERLEGQGVDVSVLDEINAAAEREMQVAIDWAEAQELAPEASLWEDIIAPAAVAEVVV